MPVEPYFTEGSYYLRIQVDGQHVVGKWGTIMH